MDAIDIDALLDGWTSTPWWPAGRRGRRGQPGRRRRPHRPGRRREDHRPGGCRKDHRTGRREEDRRSGRHRRHLVEQTELGTIIARSTSGVASEVLDMVRAQGVGLDDFFARWANRILRRRPGRPPARAADARGPAGHARAEPSPTGDRPMAPPATASSPSRVARATTPARSAGWSPSPPMPGPRGGCSPWARPHSPSPSNWSPAASSPGPSTRWPRFIALVIWEFIYFAYQWALSGKTIGMALLGIRVVRADGSPIGRHQAVIRTVDPPAQLHRLRAGVPRDPDQPRPPRVHDRFAGTAVVYSWDARAARLRWLAKQESVAARP